MFNIRRLKANYMNMWKNCVMGGEMESPRIHKFQQELEMSVNA